MIGVVNNAYRRGPDVTSSNPVEVVAGLLIVLSVLACSFMLGRYLGHPSVCRDSAQFLSPVCGSTDIRCDNGATVVVSESVARCVCPHNSDGGV